MTDLRPLLDTCDDDLERALLHSTHLDAPNPAGLRDTALALGLGASTASALAATLSAATASAATLPVATASVATLPAAIVTGHTAPLGATGVVATTSGATTAATSALGASLGMLGKGLLGGTLLSLVALTTVDQTLGTSSQPASSTPLAAPSAGKIPNRSGQPDSPLSVSTLPPTGTNDAQPIAEPEAVVHGRRFARKAPAPAIASAEAPRLVEAPASAAFDSTPPARPSPSSVGASLAAEIRILDQVRAALAAGGTARAGALLDQYASNHPSPTLAQEAALLRVRLLLARGQKSAAAESARRIIAQHPESAHVESLRRLAAEP